MSIDAKIPSIQTETLLLKLKMGRFSYRNAATQKSVQMFESLMLKLQLKSKTDFCHNALRKYTFIDLLSILLHMLGFLNLKYH